MGIRIKVKKNRPTDKATMQQLQIESSNKTVATPLENYNRFIRKQGEKILTQEEYDKMIKDAITR
jgi:oligoribonuclease NrnB/cAMP/cGMP phosphodiesterase (DHH superfamily)